MADLTKIIPYNHPQEPADVQLRHKMESMDLRPGSVVLDGIIHRFSAKDGDPDDTAGWHLGFADGIPSGAFGNWRTGDQWTWSAVIDREITPMERMQQNARISEAKRRAEHERATRQESASSRATDLWTNASPANEEHPYLQKKGIQPHLARIDGAGNLMLPLMDIDGNISSLQFIPPDGKEKRFLPGGLTKGKFGIIGTIDKKVYVSEGFATGATIYEVTKTPTIMAYSAGNIVPVVESIRSKYPAVEIIIVADNDASGVGKNYADQATAKYGATVIMPPIEGMDANDYRQAGEDIQGLLLPQKNTWLTPIDDWCSQPSPIKWLVKGWLQTPALAMVHGPSGDGKTFVLLDMALHIATGKLEWMGCKIKQGKVAYLAGEGHHGLRSRVAGWMQEHKETPRNMWVSSNAVDINTPAGLAHAMQYIQQIDKVDLIIIDTLHRFLDGDENSAQDSKGMIDACGILQREFNCTVVLVHHTGVSGEAQNRARGSSSWRGALENEISIRNDNGVIKFEAMKIKDAEKLAPIHLELSSVAITGWIDEDGEQVTTAIIKRTTAPETVEKDKKRNQAVRDISDAWFDSGMELIEGMPYITNGALGNYIKVRLGKEGANARNHKKRLVDYLQENNIVVEKSNGYAIIDEVTACGLIICKA